MGGGNELADSLRTAVIRRILVLSVPPELSVSGENVEFDAFWLSELNENGVEDICGRIWFPRTQSPALRLITCLRGYGLGGYLLGPKGPRNGEALPLQVRELCSLPQLCLELSGLGPLHGARIPKTVRRRDRGPGLASPKCGPLPRAR